MLAILILAPILWEAGVGPGLPIDTDQIAAAASVRAGFEWPVAAAGLRGIALVGPDGRYDWYDNKNGKPGFHGWALLAEVEGHARAPLLQGFLRAGLGIGQIQKITYSPDSLDGTAGLAWKLSAGIRVAVAESFWLGIEGGFSGSSTSAMSTATRGWPLKDSSQRPSCC